MRTTHHADTKSMSHHHSSSSFIIIIRWAMSSPSVMTLATADCDARRILTHDKDKTKQSTTSLSLSNSNSLSNSLFLSNSLELSRTLSLIDSWSLRKRIYFIIHNHIFLPSFLPSLSKLLKRSDVLE
jgi:hypothetical protein